MDKLTPPTPPEARRNTETEPTDYQKALLTIAHYELQYTRLQKYAHAVVGSSRPFSSSQTAVLKEMLEELKLAANESRPTWPTPPAQPPAPWMANQQSTAPLAGGTAETDAHTRVMAACDAARTAMNKLPYDSPERKRLHEAGMRLINVAAGCKEGRTVSPATGGMTPEFKKAITGAIWTLVDKISTVDACELETTLHEALTPLLDRREAELSQQWRLSSVCREKQLDIDALHQQLHITEEQVAALRTLVAKQREAMSNADSHISFYESGPPVAASSILRTSLALTPSAIADELAAKEARIKELETLAVVRWNTIEGEERRIAAKDTLIERLKTEAVERYECNNALIDRLTAAQTTLREAEAARGEAEQTYHALLPSERVQRLAQEFEKWPASEHQTKCSLLLVALVKELDVYERTRPLTDHERELIDQGWKKIKAAEDAARAQKASASDSEHD